MNMSQLRVRIIVLLGVFGASFSAILVKAATAPSIVLVFYRIGLAALLMTIPGIRAFRRELPQLSKKDLILSAISGIFLALHFFCYFYALTLSSIASVIVLVDTEVFFVAFVLILLFHEKLSKRAWIGIVITFLGSVIIAVGDAGGIGGGSLQGDLWAIGGAVSVSVYTLLGRKCRENMSTTAYTTIVYWSTAITALIMLILQGHPVVGYSLNDILCAFGMTILCTFLGHSVYSWSLKYTSASYISAAKLMEPVFSSILGIFIFAEFPSLTAIIGGAIIITGIYLSSNS